jgi:hypothetical protein
MPGASMTCKAKMVSPIQRAAQLIKSMSDIYTCCMWKINMERESRAYQFLLLRLTVHELAETQANQDNPEQLSRLKNVWRSA